MRAELHRLVHDLRVYLTAQKRGLTLPGAIAATPEERAPFDEKFAVRRTARMARAAEAIRGPAKPAEPAPTPRPAPAAPSIAPKAAPAPTPQPQATAAPTAREIPKAAAAMPKTGGQDKLWLELGSKPKPTFAPAPAAERAFAADDTTTSNTDKLAALQTLIGDCQRCGLCKTRTNLVFGVGNPNARLMFIGEAPGHFEDLEGEPFVGKAGELLNKMIGAMGFKREDVYIANVIKCRPPENRDPAPDEVKTCAPFVLQQVEAVAPQIIVTLGKFGTNALLNRDGSLTSVRGQWQEFNGVPVMPTFHPAYLLRNPDAKRDAWADLQNVMSVLNK